MEDEKNIIEGLKDTDNAQQRGHKTEKEYYIIVSGTEKFIEDIKKIFCENEIFISKRYMKIIPKTVENMVKIMDIKEVEYEQNG